MNNLQVPRSRKVGLNVSLTAEQVELLDSIAAQEEVPRSLVLRRILTEFVRSHKAPAVFADVVAQKAA